MSAIDSAVLRDWKQKARQHNYPVEAGKYEAAMTFEEIAAAMGTDRQHVWHRYASAIKKLRAQPEVLGSLLAHADALDLERSRRFVAELRP